MLNGQLYFFRRIKTFQYIGMSTKYSMAFGSKTFLFRFNCMTSVRRTITWSTTQAYPGTAPSTPG